MDSDQNILPIVINAVLHYAPVVNTIILAILGWMITEFRTIRREHAQGLHDVTVNLKAINGTVRELNQWRIDHDERVRMDAANHILTRQQCQEIHAERLKSINERISELWTRIGDRRRPKSEITD